MRRGKGSVKLRQRADITGRERRRLWLCVNSLNTRHGCGKVKGIQKRLRRIVALHAVQNAVLSAKFLNSPSKLHAVRNIGQNGVLSDADDRT